MESIKKLFFAITHRGDIHERESKSPQLNFVLKALLSFLIFISFFFLAHSSVHAATYYVDTTVTDTHVASGTPDFTTYDHTAFTTGSGTDSVYKTVADINAGAFSPDDQILFRRGQTWKAESLIVPSSGTTGHPITFGAFGSGANPLFDPTTEFNDFVADSTTIQQTQASKKGSVAGASKTLTFDSTPTEGNLLVAIGRGTNAVSNASITGWTLATSTLVTSAGTMGLWYKVAGAGESKDVVLNWTSSTQIDMSIMEWSGITSTNPLDQIGHTDNTGSAVSTRSSGTTPTTTQVDELSIAAFAMGAAVTAESYTNTYTEQVNNASVLFVASKVLSATGAQETTESWTTARLAGGLIATFKKTSVAPTAIWSRSDSNNVYQVFQDGSRMIYEPDKASMVAGSFAKVTGTPGTLYVWPSDSGNPNTVHVIEVQTPSNNIAIRFNGKSHLIFDSIDVTKAGSSAYAADVAYNADLNGTVETDVIIQNCTVSYAGGRSIVIGNVNGNGTPIYAIDVTLSNIIGHDDLDVSLWVGRGTRLIVENSTTYNSGLDVAPGAKNYPNSGSAQHFPTGILVSGSCLDCIVRGNYVHDIYGGPSILDETSPDPSFHSTNTLIEKNKIDNTTGGAVDSIKIAGNNTTVRNNIVYQASTVGYGIYTYNTPTSPLFYHNTVISPSDALHSVLFSTGTGITFKNNIIVRSGTNNRFISMFAAAATGAQIDYNEYYQISGTPRWFWGPAAEYTTFAAWKGDTHTPDAHSLTSDPVFVTNYTDLHLQKTSPVIDAGVDLGVTSDYAGTTRPLGSAPDIGAYEYIPLTVTINQKSDQVDPTNSSTINFTVVFSGTVADFTTGDVALSGTAGATTGTVTGSGTIYNVAVTGMTGGGTVIASLAAGVATGAAGNTNEASTSTDNTVTFNSNSAPTNDSLTFTNPDGGSGNNAVADDSTEWNFRVVVSDADGYTNLDTVILRLANSSDNVTPFDSLKFTWTQSSDTFTETADTQNAATITSTGTDSTCSGNTCTLDFKIKFNSNFTSQSTNYNAELYTTDDASASDTDTYSDFYQVTPFVATISISSPANISLGTITGTGDSSIGEATWTVTTDNPNGYKLEWQAGGEVMTDATSDTIAAYTPASPDTPEAWSILANASEWGGRLKSTSTDYSSGTWGADDSTNSKWLNVKNSAVFQIINRGSSTAGSDEVVQFKATIGSDKSQPTGDYSVNVTVTATTL